MTTIPEETAEQPAHDAPSHPFPIAVLDLEEEVRRTRACPMAGGHYSRTLLRTADMRIVLMILERGTRLTEHDVDGASTIQILDGRVTVSLLGTTIDLASGQVLAIERRVRHELVAIVDSAILLTIAWDREARERSSTASRSHPPAR